MDEHLNQENVSILWFVGGYGLARISWAVFRWRTFLGEIKNTLLLILAVLAAGFAVYKFIAPLVGYYFPEWFLFFMTLSAYGNAFLAVIVGEILNFIVRRSFSLPEEDQKKAVEVSSLIVYADRTIKSKRRELVESQRMHNS